MIPRRSIAFFATVHCISYAGAGGDGVIRPDGVKDCSGCLVPHKPENYERIIRRLKAAIREAAMCEEDARERTPMPNKRANHVLPRLSRSAGK